ncbi:thioredoxin-like protein [Talaromyces proteolyticus]|uniref:thioredoxin-dependent peroxiredoxin n=1 Tax=Talaromyces proteolyticus TaxID=1131652 RepID=A0AAD4KQC4_9EURO|nr:thioredoxin-like protein [Talaromyces proteolyticus]KAH8693114.1 thioredoxin-like protein [Talaromyces proteolyticus]
MVELRKRKTPPSAAAPAQEKKPKSTKPKGKAESTQEKKKTSSASSKTPVPKTGETISLKGFGGEIQTNDGTSTTLEALVASSKSGIVIFTYPKASTPGCTKQACMFRDKHEHLTSTGLSIYGLSADSPKANTTFKTKQNLPYPLLCDPNATLIGSLGLKKSPKGTVRGVFAVDKNGKVLLLEHGSPVGTVDAVEKIVGEAAKDEDKAEEAESK